MNFVSQNKLSISTQKTGDQQIDFLQYPAKIFVSEQEILLLKWEVGYWKSLFQRAKKREEELQMQLQEKEGKIRDLQKRLFGKSNEKTSSGKNKGDIKPAQKPRPRGQQEGSKGHGRTPKPDFAMKEEYIDLSPGDKCCPICNKPYAPNGTEDSEIMEVEVKGHIRRIKRKSYKKTCSCEGVPDYIIAPPVPRFIPQSSYDISIWEGVLLNKFLYSHPTSRLLNYYEELGLPI